MLVLASVLLVYFTASVSGQFCNPFGTPTSPIGCLLPEGWRLEQDPNDAQTCTDCATVKADTTNNLCYYRTTDTSVGNEHAFLTIADFYHGWTSLELRASFRIRIGHSSGAGSEGISFNWGPDLPALPSGTNGPDEEGYGIPRGSNEGITFAIDIKGNSFPSDFVGISIIYKGVVINSVVVADAATLASYPNWSTVSVSITGTSSFTARMTFTNGVNVYTAQGTIAGWTGLSGDFMIGAQSTAPAQYHDIADVQIQLDEGKLNRACCVQDIDCYLWPGTVCETTTGDCIVPFCSENDDSSCTKTAPKCLSPGTGTSSCGACTVTDDCYRWPGTGCNTITGACEAALGCFNGASCGPITPVCTAGTCGLCASNTDCSFWPGTVCSLPAAGGTGACIVPPCDDGDDASCTSTLPRCSNPGQWNSQCASCISDQDCYRWPGTVCYTSALGSIAAGTCALPECSQNDDCTSAATPHCANPGAFNSDCVTCQTDTDCYQWPGTVCHVTNGNCVVPACRQGDDCTSAAPHCTNPGRYNAQCTGCIAENDCYPWPGTACAMSGPGSGGCVVPACYSREDCSRETAVCANAGKWNAMCVGCSGWDDCTLWPSTIYCDPSNAECSEGCYTDGHCAEGYQCLNHVCVECINSYHCFTRDQSRPVCSANNTCVMCTQDADCLDQVVLFEACHIEWEHDNVTDEDVQVVGRCVIDTYNKGLQISALILGSLGMFGVGIASVIAIIAASKASK